MQLAIVHAEFEALHPFKDGNGRLGRMLIPLFLFGRRLLGGPNFYMSGYLEARRDEYVDALRADLTEMLCALAHHRQRGADLIFAAYDVDIGGG